MKEKPILFSTDMVKAILEGRKTMTRRIIKPQPDLGIDPFEGYSHITVGNYSPALIDKNGEMYPGEEIFGAYTDDGEWGWKCPYGQVGGRLWVRETWKKLHPIMDSKALYKADMMAPDLGKPWRPSIFMPRWASRILLEITEVRVERLNCMTESDVSAEGYETEVGAEPKPAFSVFWDSINAKRGYGWSVNPWVWVIEFKRN